MMTSNTLVHETSRETSLDSLKAWGLDSTLAAAFTALAKEGEIPARVTADFGKEFLLQAPWGETRGVPSGRLRTTGNRPTTGDWVVCSEGADARCIAIHAIVERKSAFVRAASANRRSDKHTEQIIAANIDLAFIVMSVSFDLNLRRLERYLAVALASGAAPVIVLSKIDLAQDRDVTLAAVRHVAGEIPVLATSSRTGEGLENLRALCTPGRTLVFLGSSGVGKSSLLNALAGSSLMHVNSLRRGIEKGQHTTTHRQLFALENGALAIDTPGMRELRLCGREDTDEVFADLDAHARSCHFPDCRHEGEPDCAVQAAIASGRLDAARLISWRKLRQEAAIHAEKAFENRCIQSRRALKKARSKEHESERKARRTWRYEASEE